MQGGRALPKRAEARRWLSANRADQVRLLAEAWRDSTRLRRSVARPRSASRTGSRDDEPVQPGGGARRGLRDHDSTRSRRRRGGRWTISSCWFTRTAPISSARTAISIAGTSATTQGEYLSGLESWDAVEGALLEFLIAAPMHWLGLIDLAEDAARLTAYGRAFLGLSAWPNPPDQPDKIEVQADGTILDVAQSAAHRPLSGGALHLVGSRWRRTTTATASIRRGSSGRRSRGSTSGISARSSRGRWAIRRCRRRSRGCSKTGKPGPTAQVSVERLLVLRTTAPETLDFILETPGIRRFMGARLGPMAAIVRAGRFARSARCARRTRHSGGDGGAVGYPHEQIEQEVRQSIVRAGA